MEFISDLLTEHFHLVFGVIFVLFSLLLFIYLLKGNAEGELGSGAKLFVFIAFVVFAIFAGFAVIGIAILLLMFFVPISFAVVPITIITVLTLIIKAYNHIFDKSFGRSMGNRITNFIEKNVSDLTGYPQKPTPPTNKRNSTDS